MAADPAHLIICCCHAIYLSTPVHDLPAKPAASSSSSPSKEKPEEQSEEQSGEQSWLLASFQSGETPTFKAHIIAGLDLLLSDSQSSLLVFSGSQTRSETEISEAQSYLNFCVDNEFFGFFDALPEDVATGQEESNEKRKASFFKEKIILEEQALDSFGNLLFSIIAFWRRTNTWPEKITIISHAFKRDRFLSLHCRTLRLPSEKLQYLGIDPAYMLAGSEEYDSVRSESVIRGEKERGFSPWEIDPWGTGELLKKKRWGRNCWGVGQELFKSEEERRGTGVKTRRVESMWEGRTIVEEVLDEAERWPWE